MTRIAPFVLAVMCWASQVSDLAAHSGPPFPIVTDRQSGNYVVSIWTDPDATDDRTAGGRFWIVVGTTAGKAPPGTQVSISVKPDAGGGAAQTARVTEAASDGRTYYGALVLDHEGSYRVDVGIDGPLGNTTVPSHVDATYDLRPSPLTAVLYVVPFALIGLLWARMLLKRSRSSNERHTVNGPPATFAPRASVPREGGPHTVNGSEGGPCVPRPSA